MRFFFKHTAKRLNLNGPILLGLSLFAILFGALSPDQLVAQITRTGTPLSSTYALAENFSTVELPAPDVAELRSQDIENEKLGINKRVGVSVPVTINLLESANRTVLPGGELCWRMKIICRDAKALGLYFDDFYLPSGYELYVYDENKRILLGAFTDVNNDETGLFAIELIPYDKIIVELNASAANAEKARCTISELSYVYDDLPSFIERRGSSDDCEVNINCPEGTNWQYQKHGVARIYVKDTGGYFWCSGSLVNNTLQNNEPYVLTANHCAPTASEQDFAQWIFYFNYEAPGCENPATAPVPNTMTGAIRLAGAGTDGSDFLLIRLMDDVPENYGPYYNGWYREDVPSPNGVCIHHPAGDIKKISTYTQQIQSTQWSGTPGTHWLVYWSATETNWGVTEGGSSGAPLFDHFGRIIGTLTGGQASCTSEGGGGTGPDQPDYFGKVYYSWDQNGDDSTLQLKYWLDPINTGATSISGKNANLTAAFKASETLILAGNNIEYTNLSSGIPILWEWTFEGGEPSFFSGPNPGIIKYPNSGIYDVKLVVSDGFESDTLLLTDYIQVVGKVYPNPTKDVVNIFIEEELPAKIKATLINTLGQTIYEEEFADQVNPLLSFDLSNLSPGIYTIRLEIKQRYVFARVMLLQK